MADFAQISFQPNRPLLRELTADRLNSILREIKQNKPKGERGITVRQEGNQTWIGLAASLTSSRGGTASTTHPFQISSRKNPANENQYLVTVTPGTLNNLLPTNLYNSNALRTFPIPANQLGYVILEGSTNASDQFVSCSLSVSDQAPPAQSPTMFSLPVSPQFLLGVVYNEQANNVITNNLSLTGKQQFITDKQPPAPAGQLPYEIWYVWG